MGTVWRRVVCGALALMLVLQLEVNSKDIEDTSGNRKDKLNGLSDTCAQKCQLPANEKDVKCVKYQSTEECVCKENDRMFDYQDKTCKKLSETCAEKCNLIENGDVKCVKNQAEEVCICIDDNEMFDYGARECKECVCFANTKPCRIEDGKPKCECLDNFYVEEAGVCVECVCGENTKPCRLEDGEPKCECNDGYYLVGTECKELSETCAENCNLPANEGNVICDEQNSEDMCVCTGDEKKFDYKAKDCKQCYCGEHMESCELGADGYPKCICKPKYYLVNGNCENTCTTSEDCHNGAMCSQGECKCLPLTTGPRCQVVNCSSVDPQCRLSGGSCQYNVSSKKVFCKCQKPKTYNSSTGRCEDEKSCESDSDCHNGARCFRSECKCWPKTSGRWCQIIDCSSTDPYCRWSGGSCRYDVTRKMVFCECQKPKTFNIHTRRCEDPCAFGPCQNGGTCIVLENTVKCLCRASFSGEMCENDTEKMKLALWILCSTVAVLVVIVGTTLFIRGRGE